MYSDKEGRRIQEYRPLDKKQPSTFVGETTAVFTMKGSPQQMTLPVDFQIGEGITVQQAFKRYDGLGKKAVDAEAQKQKEQLEEAQKRQAEVQSKIVPVSKMPVGLDGKPLVPTGGKGGPRKH